DICNYIYTTHGRFPAHVDTIHVPRVWLQVHKVEVEYYDRFFRNGLTAAHRANDTDWDQRDTGEKDRRWIEQGPNSWSFARLIVNSAVPARTSRGCRANGLTRPFFACVALAPVSVWFFRMVFTCARGNKTGMLGCGS